MGPRAQRRWPGTSRDQSLVSESLTLHHQLVGDEQSPNADFREKAEGSLGGDGAPG